jgi:hypothetical protein
MVDLVGRDARSFNSGLTADHTEIRSRELLQRTTERSESSAFAGQNDDITRVTLGSHGASI